MENKINIAELLRNCPTGMELDCTMFDNVTFVRVYNNREQFPIEIAVSGLRSKYLTKEGCFHDTMLLPEAKCVIFPKGKTTWVGFVPPYQFKDGDVLTYMVRNKPTIYIYRKNGRCNTSYYVGYSSNNECLYEDGGGALSGNRRDLRLATKEERQKLLDIIKAHGYRWNAETKTLERLAEPKFKVGDKIKYKNDEKIITITAIKNEFYFIQYFSTITNDYQTARIFIKDQDKYELVPNKFDVTTLKPFDKVLVRDFDNTPWEIEFFSRLFDGKHFKCLDVSYTQCVPYENNEHLIGTTNDCDDFYKTWE